MASTEGVNIVISGDSSQAVKAVDDVSKAINGVKDSSVKVTADASQAIGEAEKLASSIENINDAHTEITADSSQAVGEADKASSAMENVNDAHAEITADGSQAVDETKKVANAEENIKDAHSTITADGSQALEETEKVKKVITEINGKKVTFTISPIIKDAQGRLRDIQGRFLNMGDNAGKAFSSGFASTAEQGISNSVKNIKKSFDTMLSAKVGSQIAQGFETALTSITGALRRVAGAVSSVMKSALSIGGGFEAQITNVKVISGATEQELDMLIKKAREMGATLPITAKDAATAMQLLAQRGTSAKDILASVSEVANLTISQGVDMASAAELLGSTMTNFGISVNDASKITAIFNNACNQSALSMSKLIEAMKYVGPAAGAVDMQLTEAVSAMEAIANAGLTGEMTGTGLAMVLSKLAAKSQIAGVSTKNLDGSLRHLKDIFTELKARGFSLVDAIDAFGQRGSKAALALARNSDKLAENEEKLKNWGSTQAAVDAKAKTFTNTMAAFRSAIEELHIEIFEQIKDKSKEAVGGLAELTRAFSKWVGETQIAGQTLNSFLDGLGFKIPSGADFQTLLKQFDVQAFVNKVKDFGSTVKGIGESIASAFNTIKTPLSWLIEHLDTFVQISFWGWIFGKGLQIPAAIMGIVTAFKALADVVKALLGLSWAKLAGFIATPLGFTVTNIVAGLAAGIYFANKTIAANEKLRKTIEEEKRYLQEQAKADFTLPVDIEFDFKTGFEKLPESWAKASDKVRAEANNLIKELQEKFKRDVAEAIAVVIAKFPEMAHAMQSMGAISDTVLRQISAALHGDEEAFKALPEHLKKVTEQLNAMSIAAGKGGEQLVAMFSKYQQSKGNIFFDFDTGFEKLPKSFANASERLRSEMNITVNELQEKFKGDVSNAILSVMAKFPELADKFKDAAGSITQISNSALQQISNALHGDEEVFKALPKHLQKVTEELIIMRKAASDSDIQIRKLFSEYIQGRLTSVKEDESVVYLEKLNETIKSIMDNLPKEIERANKLLKGQDKKFAIEVALNNARTALDKFAKDAAKEYNTSKELIYATITNALDNIDGQYREAALSVLYGWKNVTLEFDDFMQHANDAVKYLGEAPEKFDATLKKLFSNIKKINPLTGELTKEFKKAHDALKQWSETNFNNLLNRIGKLRKAVENGFLDKSYLEEEIKAVAPKIKLQIVKELEPMRGQWSEKAYLATVASELLSKFQEIAGESGVKIFNRIYGDMRADSIGASIVNDVAKQLGVQIGNLASIKINGQETVQNHVNSLDKKYAELSAALKNFENLPQNISNAVETSLSKSEQLNSTQTKTETKDNSAAAIQNYSKQFSQIITGVQETTTAINNGVNSLISTMVSLNSSKNTENTDFKGILSALSDNTSALGRGSEAVLKLVNSIGELNTENKSSFAVKDYSSEFVQVIKGIQNLSSGLAAIQSTSQECVNAVKSLPQSTQTAQNIDLSSIVAPLQNISAYLNAIHNATLSNIDAVSQVTTAVKAVEDSVKSQKSEAITFNEDLITQAVIAGVNPLISHIEQNSNVYQNSSDIIARSIQNLGVNIEALRNSAEISNSAINQLQIAVKESGESQHFTNFANAINPLTGTVQNLASVLSAIQNINQANGKTVSDVLNVIRSLENSVKSLEVANNYDIDIHQQGFMIEKKSDADMLARSTATALRMGIGNGGL